MSSKVVFTPFYIPVDSRELLKNAARPFHEVLGIKKEGCCTYIQILQKEHEQLAATFQQALAHDDKECSRQHSWKPYLMNFIQTAAKATFYVAACGFAISFFINPGKKISATYLRNALLSYGVIGLIIGAIWAKIDKPYIPISYDLKLRAKSEQAWMKGKIEVLNGKYQEVTKELNAIQELTDTDKPENNEKVKTMTQLLLLHTYFKDISDQHY